jgi:copper chaperone CopZ
MKRTYKLEGLECANCASKIENAVKAMDGVSFASVNFLTTKMVIEAEEARFDDILKATARVVKKLEPDVIIKKG